LKAIEKRDGSSS